MRRVGLMILFGCMALQAEEQSTELRQIERQLWNSMPLSSCGIDVTQHDDSVLLEGTVATLRQKRLAYEIASAATQRRVVNEINLGDPHLADGF